MEIIVSRAKLCPGGDYQIGVLDERRSRCHGGAAGNGKRMAGRQEPAAIDRHHHRRIQRLRRGPQRCPGVARAATGKDQRTVGAFA